MPDFYPSIHPWTLGLLPACGHCEWRCVIMSLGTCCAEPDSLRPRGLQPTRLLIHGDSPGKNTGVGCQFLLPGSPWPRDWTHIPLHWQVGSLHSDPPGKWAYEYNSFGYIPKVELLDHIVILISTFWGLHQGLDINYSSSYHRFFNEGTVIPILQIRSWGLPPPSKLRAWAQI